MQDVIASITATLYFNKQSLYQSKFSFVDLTAVVPAVFATGITNFS